MSGFGTKRASTLPQPMSGFKTEKALGLTIPASVLCAVPQFVYDTSLHRLITTSWLSGNEMPEPQSWTYSTFNFV
jgi:hypothetical protein